MFVCLVSSFFARHQELVRNRGTNGSSARCTRYRTTELAEVFGSGTKKTPRDWNSYLVGDTLPKWKPVQHVTDFSCNRNVFGMRSIRRTARRRTRSRRAIRSRGRPIKTELPCSNLLVTKAWTTVAAASRNRELVVSGASWLMLTHSLSGANAELVRCEQCNVIRMFILRPLKVSSKCCNLPSRPYLGHVGVLWIHV